MTIKNSIKQVLELVRYNGNTQSLKSRIIYGSFWNLAAALSSRGFAFVASIFVARILGAAIYGQLAIINSTVALFATFAGLGLGVTSTKYIAELRDSNRQRAGRIIGLTTVVGLISGSIMTIILYIMAEFLAIHTLNTPSLAPLLRISSILLLTETVLGVQRGSLSGFEAFSSIAWISLVQGIFIFIAKVLGVYYFGLRGATWALVLSSIFGVILSRIALSKLFKTFGINIPYMKAWFEWKVIKELAFPSMLSQSLVGPVVWIGNTIIVNTQQGFIQLGLFNAANQWRLVADFLPQVLGGVLLPMVASSTTKKSNNALEAINVLAGWFIVSVLALPIMAFPEIVGWLYGKEYISDTFYNSLAIVMYVSCIISYRQGIARKLIVNNLMWWGFLDNLLWAIFFIMLVFLLKGLGSVGLALSHLIAYILNTLIFVPFYLNRKVVPKHLIVSKEVGLIWGVLSLQIIGIILNFSLIIRAFLFLIGVWILFASYKTIWVKSNKYLHC